MAAIDYVIERLSAAGCNPRRIASYFMARCPSHPDSTPSLKITVGTQGRVLMHCHGGCKIDEVLRAAGLTMRNLFSDVITERRSDTNARPFLVRFRDAVMASDLPSSARLLMFVLSTHADKHGGSCYPGQRRLQSEANLSSRTVVDHLNVAELHGFIQRFKRGQADEYLLLIPTTDHLPPASGMSAELL